jgi:hypothetical protein
MKLVKLVKKYTEEIKRILAQCQPTLKLEYKLRYCKEKAT